VSKKSSREKFSVDPFRFHAKDSLRKFSTTSEPIYANDTDYTGLMNDLSARSSDRQDLLFAERRHGVIAIFQGMDAAGKDGAIKNVFAGLNPLAVSATAFGAPSTEERQRDFLWRTHAHIPARGKIALFNRSYYEDVLTVRVHPTLLEAQGLPDDLVSQKHFWRDRLKDIASFEEYLSRQGFLVLKFFLNISAEEQRTRLLARVDDHRKNWKFDPQDLEDRRLWPEFMKAFQDCFRATSTRDCPWYIIPADDKKNARLIISSIFCAHMEALNLKDPAVSAAQIKTLKKLGKGLR
jgi:PPK2 family polyphosphate:nucleotide phosphotransferase